VDLIFGLNNEARGKKLFASARDRSRPVYSQTAIISLISIKKMIFAVERRCFLSGKTRI
jgi:hypothetical protein